MANEQQFIHDGLQRQQIDEFFANELGRAGYGGMEVAKTPMGTQIVLRAEKPGMVIGKGGRNIRKITAAIEDQFGLDDPQIDVQEVDEPDLNAQIVADRLANALERGWYFRKAGHTTVDRIVDAGARGAQIVLAGKVTGARSRIEKFNRGYIKHNGEPAENLVDRGDGVAVMKLGTIGVTVHIIPPGADLPDDFRIRRDADISGFAPEEVPGDEVEGLLEEPEETQEGEPTPDADAETPGEAADVGAEEIVEEDVDIEEGRAETSPAEHGVEPRSDEPAEPDESIEPEISEEAVAEAEDLMAEMEADEADIEAAQVETAQAADESGEREDADGESSSDEGENETADEGSDEEAPAEAEGGD